MAQTNGPVVDLNDYLSSGTAQPKSTTNPANTAEDIQNILNSSVPAIKAQSQSTYNKGKSAVFGADMDNHMYERYYNHPKFKELGFNPFINNEALYNANSTFGDDFSRTWGQWKSLVYMGAKDAFSFGPASDKKFARDFENAMAIGSSNRGGVGGFMNNLFLNSGYTFGIMAEILAEEAAMWVGSALTGFSTAGLAAARTAENLARLGKTARTGERLTGFFAKTNKAVQGLDGLEDVNVARNVFQSMKTGTIAAGKYVGQKAAAGVKAIPGMLVPESAQFLTNFSKLDNLSGASKTAKGFGAFYRDVRNLRLAYGESALEAGMVENETLKNLYDDFRNKNGRDPNADEIAKIRKTAGNAAMLTHNQNLPLIFFSNQIVFNSFFKSFSPLRKLMPIIENKAGSVVFGKAGPELLQKGGLEGLKTFGKGLVSPRAYGRFALHYISGNLTEGLQETSQEIISGTNKDYYRNLHNSSMRGGYYDSLLMNAQKYNPFTSSEGLEIFASGFLMGGIVGSVGSVTSFAKDRASKFWDKDYAENKKIALDDLKEKQKITYELYSNPLKWDDQLLNGTIELNDLEAQQNRAQEKGDAKGFHDAKYRSMATHFYTVFELGMEKSFKKRFTELSKLSDEELLEQMPTVKDAAKARASLEEMAGKIDEFKKNYEYVKKELENPFDPSRYKANSPEQHEEALNMVKWREAQKDVIFMREGFKTGMIRMSTMLQESAKDVGVSGMLATDVQLLYNLADTGSEIQHLQDELRDLGTDTLVTREARALKASKEEKLKRLTEFYDDMTVLMSDIKPITDTGGETSGKVISTKENVMGEAAYNKALKSYKAYIKSRAKGPVDEKNLEASFSKMVDYYMLDIDTKRFNDSINTLMNPNRFYAYADRKGQVIQAEYDNRKQRIGEALTAYKAQMDKNDLLNELYNRGVFFDIEDLEKLEKDGIMPKRFYKTTSPDQIKTTSPEYNDAVELVTLYAKNVLNIPIQDIQLQYNEALNNYNTETRAKNVKDERTYEQLAEQFGFDPKASKTVLPLKDVLQAVIESEFTTEEERALALRLLSMAKPNETITFSKELAAPNIYTEAEQSVVDARYSAHEYKENAQSYPMEVSILRSEMNRRLFDATKDPEFNAAIQDIMAVAIQYYNQQGLFEKPFIGLTTPEAFVIEVMTSDSFRQFLSEVEYPETGKSSWMEFVDKVMKWLEAMWGKQSSNTALNAAFNVITTKIDQTYSKAHGKTTTTSKTSKSTDLASLPISELADAHPKLVEDLVRIYVDYHKAFDGIDASRMYDTNYATKTPEQIITSPEFENFVKDANDKVRAAFEGYAKTTAPTVRTISRKPGVEPLTETDQEFLTSADIKRLKELEYTDEDIDDMTVLEGLNIILFGETKSETEARIAEEESELDLDRDLARQSVADELNKAVDYATYLEAEAKIIALMNTPDFSSAVGYTIQEIDDMLNEKRKEIAFKLEFDDVQEGDYLIRINLVENIQGQYKVIKKTANQLILENVKNSKDVKQVSRARFKSDNAQRQLFKYNPNIKDDDVDTPTITPDATNISNDNVNGINDISDEDLNAAIAAGKSISVDDALTNFFDAQGKACE
jgi:hypothetical protein